MAERTTPADAETVSEDVVTGSPPWEAERRARPIPPRPEEQRRRRHRRSRLGRRILFGLGIVLLVLLVDLAWAGWSAYHGLTTAEADLRSGGTQLVTGDLIGAHATFDRAGDAAQRAVDAFAQPGPRLLQLLPWIGDDVAAGGRVAEAAHLAGLGGARLVDAAQAAGWDGHHVPGFGTDGRIDTAVIQQAEPALVDASRLLGGADSQLRSIDLGGLLAPVRDAVARAQEALGPRATQARNAALAARLLPGFLGADGPRTYLLVMLQPSDPRGSGGYPGMYALVHVDGHRIQLQSLRPTNDIPSVPKVEAPAEVRRRYDTWGSRTSFWDTTYTPDFPTAARLMLGIWSAAGHSPVDGIIAADSTLLSGVLDATGPVSTPDWPDPITSGNVQQVLGRDTYLTTSQPVSDGEQTAVGNALWHAVLSEAWSPNPMFSALGGAVGTRHLQVFATDPNQEALLSALNVDGGVTFPAAPNPLVMFEGISANRAGYFAQFDTTTKQERTFQGTEVTVTVTMHNTAPDGPPSILLGIPGGGPIGQFAVEMDMYLPPGAQVLSSTTDGTQGLQLVQHEYGRPVVLQYLIADAGKTSVAVVRYLIPS